ncbi:MAG: ACP S-malonyltransferase [Blastocatellia bacterium]|nr:ACP S-malonyltransferase [Blastocatellia bacterium]MCS7157655.1 ACP S-malonyltransferase [Blastocatellia bacterium]MCX7751920.1 ACP S-malonyltransferase [Blastocatellia bacterium]MDW8167026.1 ACP S-malonyltransferase [Acidobacteriota bacterium]MDW8257130.1 ACP S-malonyltransferase [Acidobacteriota bacterium]
MSRIACVFPGQGSQYSGMGHRMAEAYASAREVFERADAALGFPISRLCFEGDEEELKRTENTQPAILTTSVACYRVLEQAGVRPDFVAGHSLGEYTALVAADSLAFEDAVGLVRRRGQYMQEAVPIGQGAMAAILGASVEVVEQVCREAAEGQVCAPANFNSPQQIVIAGHKEAVERAIALARERGARRVVLLPVSAPFHCALMQPAEERLAADLARVAFADLKIPLVNNVEAAIVTSGEAAREGLRRQVSRPVRWEESVRRLLAEGVTTFIEVGPGRVLSGLIRQIDRSVRTLAVEDPDSLEETLKELRA